MITDALDALPADLGDDLRAKAETLIVTEAATLGPRELRVYGTRLLEYLAPDIAEEADYRRLSPRNSAPPRPPGSPSAAAATGPPTCTPGSPTTPPAACAPTSTPTPPPDATTSTTRRHGRDAVRTTRSRRPGRVRPAALGPATRRGVRRAAGEHPHHQPAPARRHRHQRDGRPRLPDPARESTRPAPRPPPPARRSPPARPDDSPARPGSSPSSSAPTARSSTSAAPDGWSPTPSARP